MNEIEKIIKLKYHFLLPVTHDFYFIVFEVVLKENLESWSFYHKLLQVALYELLTRTSRYVCFSLIIINIVIIVAFIHRFNLKGEPSFVIKIIILIFQPLHV